MRVHMSQCLTMCDVSADVTGDDASPWVSHGLCPVYTRPLSSIAASGPGSVVTWTVSINSPLDLLAWTNNKLLDSPCPIEKVNLFLGSEIIEIMISPSNQTSR